MKLENLLKKENAKSLSDYLQEASEAGTPSAIAADD
jgi:hypothetical protein